MTILKAPERHFIPIKHYCNLSRQLSKVTTGKSFLQQNFLISAND